MRVGTDERLWQHWPGAVTRGFARAFGDAASDLDLDFADSRAEVVTSVLTHCLRPHEGSWSADAPWSWTLAQRLQALLVVARASEITSMTLLPSCAHCAERFELAVALAMFERDERVTEFSWLTPSGSQVRVTLPTGREQREWSDAETLTMRTMARGLVRDIDGAAPSSEWNIPEEWIDVLAQALEQHDPLTALELESQCPACGTSAQVALDLEGELLALLHQRQRRTLSDVHRIASAYHWSESAILQLPTWRRRYYLAHLGAGGNT